MATTSEALKAVLARQQGRERNVDAGVFEQVAKQHKKGQAAASRVKTMRRRSNVPSLVRAPYDPRKFPQGRVSRIFLTYPPSDWVLKCDMFRATLHYHRAADMQTVLRHALVTVLQSMVRGRQVRVWFRHNIAALRQRRTSREQFSRLASIGRSTSLRRTRSSLSDNSDKVDLLQKQLRDDDEDAAMDTIRQNRRTGSRAVAAEELRLVGHRFSRIGKQRTQSGVAVQQLHAVIQTGKQAAEVTKAEENAKASSFVPPSVTYNPFLDLADALARCAAATNASSRRSTCDSAAARSSAGPGSAAAACAHKPDALASMAKFGFGYAESQVLQSDVELTQEALASESSAGSDWSDMDAHEFDTMRGKLKQPEHVMAKVRSAAGAAELLRNGQYRPQVSYIDANLVHDRLEELQPWMDRLNAELQDEWDPATDDLPESHVRKILKHKRAATEARLGVPIYSSVGWQRGVYKSAQHPSEPLGPRVFPAASTGMGA